MQSKTWILAWDLSIAYSHETGRLGILSLGLLTSLRGYLPSTCHVSLGPRAYRHRLGLSPFLGDICIPFGVGVFRTGVQSFWSLLVLWVWPPSECCWPGSYGHCLDLFGDLGLVVPGDGMWGRNWSEISVSVGFQHPPQPAPE